MKEVDIISKVVGRGVDSMNVPSKGLGNIDPSKFLLRSVWESLWEIRKDKNGAEYLFGKLPVALQYGLTMYNDVGNLELQGIYDGLPIDGITLYWEEVENEDGTKSRILKAKGGNGDFSVDGEDLTVVEVDGENVVRFNDRNSTNGMGYVILRKDSPISEQMTESNTVYEVRYDFSIDSVLNVPSDCVLSFVGGSIQGGTVVFNNTMLTGTVKVYSDIQGKLFGGIAKMDWFVEDSSIDSTKILNQLISIVKRIEFSSRVYVVNGTVEVKTGTQLIGNGCTISATGDVDLFGIESNARGVIIECMTLSSDYSSDKTGAAIRPDASNGGADHIYRDLYINGFKYGLFASEVWWGNTVENVKCTMCGYSFVILGTGGQSINNTFIRCYSNIPYVCGITLGAVKSCTFINCNNGCDTGGTFLQVQTNSMGVKFVGCNFEAGKMVNNKFLFNLTSASVVNFDTCTFVKMIKSDDNQTNTIAMRVMDKCLVTMIDCTGLSNEYVNFVLLQNDARFYYRNLTGISGFAVYGNASAVNMLNYLPLSVWGSFFETIDVDGTELINAKKDLNGYLKSRGAVFEDTIEQSTSGVYATSGYSPSGAEYLYGTLVGLKSNSGAVQMHFTDGQNERGNQVFFRSKYTTGGVASLGTEWVEFITSKNIGKQNAGSADKLKNKRELWGQNFDGTEDVKGALKDVTDIEASGFFSLGGIKLSKSKDDVLFLDGNLVVRGGVTMFGTRESTGSTVMDGLVVDGKTIWINPTTGQLEVIGGAGGLNEEDLENYLEENGYLKEVTSDERYISGIGVEGSYLTYIKNGVKSNISVPYSIEAWKDGNGSVISDTYFKNRGYATATNVSSTINGVYGLSGYSPSGAQYSYGSLISFKSSASLVQLHFTDSKNAIGGQVFFRNQYTSGGVTNVDAPWYEFITNKNLSSQTVIKDLVSRVKALEEKI